MEWKRWVILGLAGLGVLMLFALTRAETSLTERESCIRNWEQLNDEEMWGCVAVLSSDEDLNCLGNRRTLTEEQYEACVAGFSTAQETVMVSKQQTSTARPTQSLESIRATEHAMWVEAGRPTPVPTSVPGIVLQGWEVIEPYHSDTKGLAPRPHWLKFTVNAWWLGAILADDGFPRRIIIQSSSRTCRLGINYIKENGWPGKGEGHGFSCPEDITPIEITGATGPTGVVTATDELSRTITFELGTEEWTLEGEPWLPAVTPTP